MVSRMLARTVIGIRRGFVHSRAHCPRSSTSLRDRNQRFLLYLVSASVGVVGLAYAAVPLYKIFCQTTGYGGTTQSAPGSSNMVAKQSVLGGRRICIRFNADTSDAMPWKFQPQCREMYVVPGETALAFFTAENQTSQAAVGVSSYNVTPFKAGVYFHKIQCFCFEEQVLGADEKVDMPVFFFVDPAFLEDPHMNNVNQIILSYTMHRSGVHL